MAKELFMRVDEVAKEMGVSTSYADKVIKAMNKKLEKTGCITLNGRIDRKFFYDQFYGTRNEPNNAASVHADPRHSPPFTKYNANNDTYIGCVFSCW